MTQTTRVYLTPTELQSQAGKELLDITIRIATDGRLDLEEIKELRKLLKANKDNQSVAAVEFLHDIMTRIAADGVIDRDELIELQLGIERIIPKSHRGPIVQARKSREAIRRERLKKQLRVQREKEREEAKKQQQLEYARYMRIRHTFAKVAGVTFRNNDRTERQTIIRKCKPGEQLILRHDAHNEYSSFAVQVLRVNGEQLGNPFLHLEGKVAS